ncbi:MAG: ABC transporter permease subunit [Spirochaetaceae bacterium]|jgi:NitT/TauT family transport system permease protein|nr:ABC transporter permease subunit [Spirochaetaceae bacterium]
MRLFLFKSRIFNPANVLFLVSAAAAFTPADFHLDPPWAYLFILVLFETAFILSILRGKKKLINLIDLYCIIFSFFLFWDLGSKVFKVLHYTLFPPPENVFYVFTQDYPQMISGFFHSMYLIITSVGIGMSLGIILGLFIGWYQRLREAFSPVITVIASVPALVYAPYIVAISPTFQSASIIVIFMGVFFPTVMNMSTNVKNVDQKLIDSARSLNLSSFAMLIRVLLPECAIPIIGSLRIRIATAFMILVMAETIGANSGLGFYVKRWAAWADYPKVFAGVLLIAVVVTGINALIGIFEKKALKWIKQPE